jgi:hypothetical protein
VQGFSAGALGFSLGITKKNVNEAHSFRFVVSELLDKLKAKQIQTVFLIDEVHNETPEMREFITTYQHLVREEYDVSLLMAGLPSSVNDVLNDKVLTFLRRAQRVELESIDPKAVEIAYDEAFGQAKRSFVEEALSLSAKATEGYPYLIQLIGYFMYNAGKDCIDEKLVQQALTLSKIELFKNVHDKIFGDLSVRDRDFLFAMAESDDPAPVAWIRECLDVTPGYISKYRERLLADGVVKTAGYGKLSFAVPYMGEYLQEKLANS